MNALTKQNTLPYPSVRYAWYVIGVLWIVTLFSQLDRQLPALMVGPLRAAFDISDTQFSLLQGYAFAVLYTLMGLPFGRMVDHTNRRNLIIFGVLVWSGMTILAGFSETYWHLLVTRMGVGVGEAVLAPAAYSMIADYVAPERRGRALGVYYVSIAIGSGASLFLGGIIFGIVPEQGLSVPIAGHLAPWQMMFLVAGSPGLLLMLLMLTAREPVRRDTFNTNTDSKQGSIREVAQYMKLHAATFSRMLTYPAILAIIGYGSLAWAPAFYERQYGLPVSYSGLVLGVLIAAAGLTGTLISGFLSDRWVAAQKPAARFRVTLVAWAIIVPGSLLWPLMPSATISFALLTVTIIGISMGQAAAPASIQDIVPNRMRGQAIALYLLIGGLLGIGFGPTSVALVTDYIFHNDQALPYSLVIVAAPCALLGLWLSWSGQKPFARTYAACRLAENSA